MGGCINGFAASRFPYTGLLGGRAQRVERLHVVSAVDPPRWFWCGLDDWMTFREIGGSVRSRLEIRRDGFWCIESASICGASLDW
jgi:hypothetical protein